MKLINFRHRKDYGDEYYVQLVSMKKWTLLQTSVSWTDDISPPYFQMTMGSNGLLSAMFWVWRVGFDIGFIERTWNWDRINDVVEKEEDCMPLWGHSDLEYMINNKNV